MYIQVIEGWRYQRGARDNVLERVRQAREIGGGRLPLQPDVPGLLGRAFGTSTEDEETGVAIWIWENREAAEAYEATRPGELVHRIERSLETGGVVTRSYDGIYFGHR